MIFLYREDYDIKREVVMKRWKQLNDKRDHRKFIEQMMTWARYQWSTDLSMAPKTVPINNQSSKASLLSCISSAIGLNSSHLSRTTNFASPANITFHYQIVKLSLLFCNGLPIKWSPYLEYGLPSSIFQAD